MSDDYTYYGKYNTRRFDDIQKMVFEEYMDNDYLAIYNNAYLTLKEVGLENFVDIVELALVSTEITEGIKKLENDEISLSSELADIVIRVMNFASRKHINLRKAIIGKHQINMQREKLHGKKVV